MKLGVICNPAKVADVEVLRSEIELRWPHDELVWLETTVEDAGAGQTRAALSQGVDLVLVCGGDGTVAECAGVLADTAIPMALVPAGTGNLLARNLGLPLVLAEALDLAASRRRDHIDLLRSGDRCFTVMAGLGFDAAMMRDTNEATKDRIGWLAYLGGGARALRRTRSTWCTIIVDGEVQVRAKALAVLVANVGTLQAGMVVAPEADPRDGLLNVVILVPRTWGDVFGLVLRLMRRRLDSSPRTWSFAGRTVTLQVDEPVPVEFDGDYVAPVRELTVTVMPKAMLLCGT